MVARVATRDLLVSRRKNLAIDLTTFSAKTKQPKQLKSPPVTAIIATRIM